MIIDKFFLPSVILEKKSFDQTILTGNLNPFDRKDEIVICSYQFIKSKEPYIKQTKWDLVIIDEAHNLISRIVNKLKKEKAISLGNLLGSNIFNVFAVLGITAIITPIQIVDRGLVDQDMIWMLAFALVVLPLVFLPKGLRLNWRDGLVLLGMYGAFLYQTLG